MITSNLDDLNACKVTFTFRSQQHANYESEYDSDEYGSDEYEYDEN